MISEPDSVAQQTAYLDLEDAARQLRRLRLALTGPDPGAVSHAELVLRSVAERLEAVRVRLPGIGREDRWRLREQLLDCRAQFRSIARMLDEAVQFYQGWLDASGFTCGGYAANGAPDPGELARSRPLVEG